MKSTGIVRKVDELGRVVIPKELRDTFNIQEKDPVEVFTEDDKIILRKYQPQKACAVTGEISEDNVVLLGGKLVLSKEGATKLQSILEQGMK